jgi:TPR repeat protein
MPEAYAMMRTPMVYHDKNKKLTLSPKSSQATAEILDFISSFSKTKAPEANNSISIPVHIDQSFIDSGQLTEESLFQLLLLGYSTDKNHININLNLGQCYELGKGVEKNLSKAIKHFQRAAQLGDPFANWKLGIHNLDIKNYIPAYDFLTKAADGGTRAALVNLGRMHFLGLGVEQNDTIAFGYFKKAAELNDPFALVNLGIMYGSGRGVELNYKTALSYYEKALPLNEIGAKYNMALLYRHGHGLPQNYEKALEYFLFAADDSEHEAEAKYQIGVLYYKGKGVQKNYKQAYKYFKESAEKNHDFSMLHLGFMLERGLYKKINIEKAINYYLNSARMGNLYAQHNLGVIYYTKGKKQNYKEAFKFFKQAAHQGQVDSQKNLGILYLNGLGVEINNEQAFLYFKQAADQGLVDAQAQVGAMYLKGLGIMQDYQQALQYLQLAADQGDDNAQNDLGEMYFQGLGVMQDNQLALYYAQLSANAGNTQAEQNILLIKNILDQVKDLPCLAKVRLNNITKSREEKNLEPTKQPSILKEQETSKPYDSRLPSFGSFANLSKSLSSRDVRYLSDVVLTKKIIFSTLFELQKSNPPKITIRIKKGKLIATQCGPNIGANPASLTVHLHDHDRPWEQQLNVKDDFFTLIQACGIDYKNMLKLK